VTSIAVLNDTPEHASPSSSVADFHSTFNTPGYKQNLLLLHVDSIRPCPSNPRHLFDEGELEELAKSIASWGQLQPIIVRRIAGSECYDIVCGERRWRAHKLAGIEWISAIERDASDQEALGLALIENLQRANLSQAEKINALDQLAAISQVKGLRKTAAQLRVDPSWLSRQLAVRRDPLINCALEEGFLGFGQAAELLRAPAPTRKRLVRRLRAALQPVPTATVRAWVESERVGSEGDEEEDAVSDTVSTAVSERLLQRALALLQSVELPRSAREREILLKIEVRLGELSPAATAQAGNTGGRAHELVCLLCGVGAGVIDAQRVVQPTSHGSVIQHGNMVVCGRCGGSLVPGETVA
jgi:ParB family transcriptional regulator, chromosome partitioning protein